MPQEITGVVITKDEEDNIRDCILSLKKVASRIIVLDSFSTDGTESICREKGVLFLQHPFDGMIQQKNRVIQMVETSHVLLLDADERLSPELTNYLLKEQSQGLKAAYEFNRLNNYCGQWIRHCGWYPDRKIRLWERGAVDVLGTNPHDFYAAKEGVKVQRTNLDLHHFTYSSIEEHEQQIIKFTTAAAKGAFGKGKRTTLFATYVKPAFKFFRDYILKAGFLDGYHGWIVCRMGAHAKRMKYLKLLSLQKNRNFY